MQVVDTCVINALGDAIQECLVRNYGAKVDIKYIQTADAFDLDMEMPFICVCTMNGKTIPILRALCLTGADGNLGKQSAALMTPAHLKQQCLTVQTQPSPELVDSPKPAAAKKVDHIVFDDTESEHEILIRNKPVLISPETDRKSAASGGAEPSTPTPSPTIPARSLKPIEKAAEPKVDLQNKPKEIVANGFAPEEESESESEDENEMQVDPSKSISPPAIAEPVKEDPKLEEKKAVSTPTESGKESSSSEESDSDSSDDEPSPVAATFPSQKEVAAHSSSSSDEDESEEDEAVEKVKPGENPLFKMPMTESEVDDKEPSDDASSPKEIVPIKPIVSSAVAPSGRDSSSSEEEETSSDEEEPPKTVAQPAQVNQVVGKPVEEKESSSESESSDNEESADMPIVSKPKFQVTSLEDIKIVRKPLWQPQTPPASNIAADKSDSSSSENEKGDSSDSSSDDSSDGEKEKTDKKHKRKRKGGGLNALIMDSAKKAATKGDKSTPSSSSGFTGKRTEVKPNNSAPLTPAVIVETKNPKPQADNKKRQKQKTPTKKERVKLKKPPTKKTKHSDTTAKHIDIDAIKDADEMLKTVMESVSQ